jgi:DNA-directed RNA polymerase specialized sigma subunit
MLERMQIKQDRLIHKLLYMHRYCGLDYDDLKIVALQTLLLAIESYDPSKNIFDAYYHFLLQRELVNELKRFSSDNHNLINTALSLDFEIEDGSLLGDLVGQQDQKLIALVEDPFHQLLEGEDQHLSVKEKAILAYLKLGYSFTEIAKILGGHYRQISKIAKTLLAKHRD